MNKLIDLTGKRFGKLIVIGHSYVRKTKLNVSVHYWLCQCDCGIKKNIVGYSLTKGKTKACGCVNRIVGKNNPTWRGYEDISASFFKHIKWSAEKRNLEFKLTIEFLWDLFLKQNKKCALTGLDLTFPKYALDTSYNISLDRKDPVKGYIIDNIQWIDKRINFMKITLQNEEFIELCQLVSNYHPPAIKGEVAV